jgi:hypothetical protein
VIHRNNWGEDRVYFHNSKGRLISVPARWTSVVAEDPFVLIAAGRSCFRVEDLVKLRHMLEELKS